ncbi:MAG: CrcB-like protein [Desulfomicrobiaceae bacterium]|jgi:CrcB protein|nr:CrcB-like protein [Desulfomicrobiaceae bacterium]MDK2873966.1 fluoride exporter [Desulfomicrobiaceae bacterium]
MKYLVIALAGALGALSRWALAGAVQARWTGAFPVGTAVVNVFGCFLFGLIATLLDERMALPPETRLALLTGFLGAFTTFSTFTFETMALVRTGAVGLAACNAVGQVIAGFFGLYLGIVLARIL